MKDTSFCGFLSFKLNFPHFSLDLLPFFVLIQVVLNGGPWRVLSPQHTPAAKSTCSVNSQINGSVKFKEKKVQDVIVDVRQSSLLDGVSQYTGNLIILCV